MLETLLYILSFVVGIALFVYLLSLYHTLKDKLIQNQKKVINPISQPKVEQTTLQPKPLKERTCPVCGSMLSRYEALYASKVVKDSTKILIYGCRYCYKPDEDPDKKKTSDI